MRWPSLVHRFDMARMPRIQVSNIRCRPCSNASRPVTGLRTRDAYRGNDSDVLFKFRKAFLVKATARNHQKRGQALKLAL